MSTHFPRYNYIISKHLDPLFALFIGVSAAALRIRREEKEKGQSGEMGEIMNKTWSRGGKWMRGEYSVKGVEGQKGGD